LGSLAADHVMIARDLTAAEELLDWLETRGYAERELTILDNSEIAIRWR